EVMCRERTRLADKESNYWLAEAEEWARLRQSYGEAPAVVSQAAEYFRHQLRHVDLALSDGRTYLMGDRFTTEPEHIDVMSRRSGWEKALYRGIPADSPVHGIPRGAASWRK